MRFAWIRALAVALGTTVVVSVGSAQQPALLAVPQGGPQLTGYPAYPTTGAAAWNIHPNARMFRGISQPVPPAPPVPPGEGAPPPPTNGEPSVALDGQYHGGDCNGGDCGRGWHGRFTNGCGAVDCCPRWYASAAGLILTRDHGNGVRTTNDGTAFVEVINTRDVDGGWEGGWEITLGRRLSAHRALEVTYWGTGLFHGSDTQLATAQGSGALGTPINFGALNDGVNNVQDLYATAAGAHLVARSNEFMNIEINLVTDSCCCDRPALDPCSCCRSTCWSWFAGVRLFRFYENLLFATSDNNTDFVFDGNEAYYDIRVHNNLIGPQIGGRLDYHLLGGKLGLWFAPRLGVYGNHISHQSFLRTGNGELFDIKSYKDDVAFMGQIDVGGDYYIRENFKIFGGYRLVGAAGVALSDEQIPQNVADLAAIDRIDSNGHVLLHGAFVGAELRW